MADTWRGRSLDDLLADHGLSAASAEHFPTDGWSGAHFDYLRATDRRGFVVKRAALAHDWIARATRDERLREATLVDAVTGGRLPRLPPAGGPVELPYLGAAADGDGSAILMPDLSGVLLAWERPGHEDAITPATIERVIDAVARLHATDWTATADGEPPLPWCPLRERILLLARPAATSYAAEGNPVGERFLAGWDAFDRLASAAARDMVGRLAEDPDLLLMALDKLPEVGLHGDLKLSNVAVWGDGRVGLIDWQMATRGPVAVELGWLLVSNVAILPDPPERVWDRYLEAVCRATSRVDDVVGDRERQADLAWIVGLLLRGWRKGLDADAGIVLPSGIAADDDLAWWCSAAVDAADRRF